MADRVYTCRFCGYSSADLENFEEDYKLHKGFWCPYCDGFTYYDVTEDNQNFKLLFEIKGKESQNSVNYRKPDFPTQVSPLRWPGGKSKFVGHVLANCKEENMVELTFFRRFSCWSEKVISDNIKYYIWYFLR